MDEQSSGAARARQRCFKRTGNPIEDRTLCHAPGDDLAVVEIHTRRQIALVTIDLELGDIGCPLLVGHARAEVTLQHIGDVDIADAGDRLGTLLDPVP